MMESGRLLELKMMQAIGTFGHIVPGLCISIKKS